MILRGSSADTMARMTTRFPHAVLWDMDGTIVDTEPYWMAAETALVESFGGTWTHEQALQLVGLGLDTSGAILQAAGVEMSVQEIVDHLTAAVMTRLVEEEIPTGPVRRNCWRACAKPESRWGSSRCRCAPWHSP